MTALVLAVLSIAFSCFFLYGWGGLARRSAGIEDGAWPTTIALGLAFWIFLGGALNLLRLAHPAALDALALAGAALAAERLRARRRETLLVAWPARASGERGHRLAWYGVAVALTGFAMVTQLKPSFYNHYDDFEKYFAHPVRMLQTGTLYGSPLNTLGTATLGGQAFLQGLVVAHAPIGYINACDAIFCFLLTLLLAGGVAIGRPAAATAAALAALAAGLVNPQYVNVAALYSGAALFSTLLLLTSDEREYAAGREAPSPAAVGLVCAALAALKTTFALFAGLHLLFAAAAALAHERPRAELRRVFASAAWCLAFLSPWLALYAPYYLGASVNPAPSAAAPAHAAFAFDLLSPRALFYGSSFAQYTFLAVAVFSCGISALTGRRRPAPASIRFAGACSASLAAYLMMTLAFRAQFGSEGGLRFVLPLLIGGAAAAPALYALGAPPRGRAALALALAVAAWAAPEAAGRAGRLARDGSMLAYLPSKSPETLGRFRAFDRSVLGGELRESVATAQRLVPPGETILVWHSAPFLLDFARNPIVDLNPSGLMGLRAKVPAYSYVLWQYRGYATRQPAYFDAEIKNSKGWGQTYEAARGRDCYRFLNDLAGRAEILSNDGQTVLLRLPPHLISSHPG